MASATRSPKFVSSVRTLDRLVSSSTEVTPHRLAEILVELLLPAGDDRLDLRLGLDVLGRHVAPGRTPGHHLLALLLHPLDRHVHDRQIVEVVARLDDQRAALVEGDGLVVVAAQDKVDAFHLRRQRPVVGDVEMGHGDDHVGAHAFELGHGLGGRLDGIGEGDVRAGRGELRRLRRQHAEEADLVAGDGHELQIRGCRRPAGHPWPARWCRARDSATGRSAPWRRRGRSRTRDCPEPPPRCRWRC